MITERKRMGRVSERAKGREGDGAMGRWGEDAIGRWGEREKWGDVVTTIIYNSPPTNSQY